MKGANPSFQKFIEEALAEIERLAGDNNMNTQSTGNRMDPNNKNSSTSLNNLEAVSSKPDPEFWMERWRCLKKRF